MHIDPVGLMPFEGLILALRLELMSHNVVCCVYVVVHRCVCRHKQ